MEKPIIDLSNCGAILDASEGALDCSENFKNVLAELYSLDPFPAKRQKVQVAVSKISYRDALPFRYNRLRTYTFGYLCKLYKELFHRDFDLVAHEKERDNWFESYARQGQRNSAWGLYSQSVYLNKKAEQRAAFKALSPKEQEKEKARMDKEGSGMVMFVGG